MTNFQRKMRRAIAREYRSARASLREARFTSSAEVRTAYLAHVLLTRIVIADLRDAFAFNRPLTLTESRERQMLPEL